MLEISLDTEEERWMWGGIIGGTSIVFVAVSLAIRRVCKTRIECPCISLDTEGGGMGP
jgi:hypothetical protein